MQKIILFTKRFELKFTKDNTARTDVSALIEELSKDYVVFDNNPIISFHEGFQYVTLKLLAKDDRKKIGF